MEELQCEDCNYKFMPKGDRIPLTCPYCDKKGTLRKVKKMQDWIDEVAVEESNMR